VALIGNVWVALTGVLGKVKVVVVAVAVTVWVSTAVLDAKFTSPE
jgi:hypothetical protein